MQPGRISVGRLGEAPEVFTLDQIKQGAVRESGILPELYESPWPKITTGVLATGVDRKYREHLTCINNNKFAFPLYLPPALFPRALEDSKEAEKGQAHIARGKLDKSFITPFNVALDTFSEEERRDFLKVVTKRAGIPDIRHLVAISDDRNSVLDPAVLRPLYGDLTTHWNPQVREIFNEDHLVPGKRVKETDSAHYGIINSVYLREKTYDRLAARNAPFRRDQRMDTTLCIAPVVKGVLPLPEEGMIIRAEGLWFETRPITEQDLEDLKNGRIFTHDDFNMIITEDFPDGISLGELKQKHPTHPYLADQFSPAAALSAFAHMVGIPKRGEDQPLWRSFFDASKKPQTVVSNMAMLTAAPSRQETLDTLPLPPHMRLSNKRASKGGFRSLRELEEILHSGQAFVVQDPDQFEVPKNHGLKDKHGNKVSDEDIRLLRRLETDLIFSYLVTMSTQPGSANHFGRSHMVEKSYWEKYGQWHPDFCNLGLAGDIENEAYRLYEGELDLHAGLSEFDRTVYKHNVPTPANDFIRSEDDLVNILGIDRDRYIVSSYGSASSYIDKAYKDAEEYNYQLARLGVITNDGGGARSAMLGARNGNLRALSEGFNVLNVGIRSETDVSPLEGNIEDDIKSIGFEPIVDKTDDRHFSYAEGQFHILKLNRLLQRQSAIAAMSDCATYFAGGNGTVVEAAIVRLHNAKVKIFGQGLFPGYDNDSHSIPMVFVNHEFEYLGEKRGIFDILNKPYMDKATFFDMHVFDGENRIERAVDFVKYHAATHGYRLENTNGKEDVSNDFLYGL
ncbi:MAG: hypothetical protein ACLFR0_03905 [Alphaproteobacteria bacterium]